MQNKSVLSHANKTDIRVYFFSLESCRIQSSNSHVIDYKTKWMFLEFFLFLIITFLFQMLFLICIFYFEAFLNLSLYNKMT